MCPIITGASLTVDAVADTTGLRSLTAAAQVAPASAIPIGPLTVAPVVEVSAGPAASPAHVAVGLVTPTAPGPAPRCSRSASIR